MKAQRKCEWGGTESLHLALPERREGAFGDGAEQNAQNKKTELAIRGSGDGEGGAQHLRGGR